MKIKPIAHQLPQSLVHALAVVRAMFKEIFEESAYARFLGRHGISSSREAYAAFLRETEATRVRRPRCC